MTSARLLDTALRAAAALRLGAWRGLALLAVLAALWPSVARAEVELSLSLGAREVAVGESVQVRFEAMSTEIYEFFERCFADRFKRR